MTSSHIFTQIEIVGTNELKRLAIRQVSFSKDSCEHIPKRRNGESPSLFMVSIHVHIVPIVAFPLMTT